MAKFFKLLKVIFYGFIESVILVIVGAVSLLGGIFGYATHEIVLLLVNVLNDILKIEPAINLSNAIWAIMFLVLWLVNCILKWNGNSLLEVYGNIIGDIGKNLKKIKVEEN